MHRVTANDPNMHASAIRILFRAVRLNTAMIPPITRMQLKTIMKRTFTVKPDPRDHTVE